MKKNYTLLQLLMLCVIGVQAQSISFTKQENVLGSIGGSSYEDCIVDMNNDYLDDIVRVSNNGIYIDYQQADGSYTQVHFNLNLEVHPSWSMCAGDLNEDGFNDLLLASGNAVSFVYSQDGGASYTEVAHPEYIFSQRSSMADIDNDGDLDAFVCHDVDQSHPYRNDGTGAMTLDQTLIETADLPGNYAVLWVDYDNDNDIDLYVTKCRQGSSSGDIERTNLMYRNNGDGSFTEVGEEINMADNAQSWTTVFEDFDNDGDFDAFIVNHDFQNRFMINDGNGNFTDIIETTGINATDLGAWENSAADFNNDGYVDIFSELQSELYINNGDLTFTAQELPFRNGAIGDANNDGFLDIMRYNDLWLNDANDNNWVKINTQGILSNPNGIGARVECYGDWGMQIREVRSTQSFSQMHSLAVHFGLGAATEIDSIVVKWPSGVRTMIEEPAINQSHVIPELDCLLSGTYEIDVEGETVICYDGEVELKAPNGFDEYMWSNGESSQTIMASVAGSYTVVMTNADDCSAVSLPVHISYIQEPSVEFTYDGNLTGCASEGVILTAMGEGPFTWSDGQEGEEVMINSSGDYFVMIDSVCGQGSIASESIEFSLIEAPVPTDIEVAFDQMPNDVATLTATGTNIKWYADEVTNAPLAEGNTFVTPPITEATTYYVSSTTDPAVEQQSGGKLNNAGNGGLPTTGAHSFFDVWDMFVLKEVTVYVPNTATLEPRTIQLFDGDDNMLEEMTTEELVEGANVITLNWDVPMGEDLSLRCVENNLFRNSGGVEYPYDIGDMGEITGSVYGDSYYYYFYDWKVERYAIICESERVAVPLELVNVVDLPSVESFAVFPNPVQDKCNFSFNTSKNGTLAYALVNNLGQEVIATQTMEYKTGQNQNTINVDHLPAGVYTLKLTIGNHVSGQKIVIE